MPKNAILKILLISCLAVFSSPALAASCEQSWDAKVPILFMCKCSNKKLLTACEAEATARLRKENNGCDDLNINRMDMHVNRLRKYPKVSRIRCVKAWGHFKPAPAVVVPLTPAGPMITAPALPTVPTAPGAAPVPASVPPASSSSSEVSHPRHDGVPDSLPYPDSP